MCPGARAPCRATSATSVNGLRPSAGSAARWRRSCGTWNDFLPARKDTDMTKRLLPVCLVASFALVAAARSPGAQNPSSTSTRWFKGNTHTHTVNSDGDSTPDEVVRWYREHGYNFLVLTDHNYLTSVDGLNAIHGAADKFIVVRGEEVTSTASSKAVHVNGLNVDALVKQSTSPSVVTAAQENVDGIRRANG